MEKTKQKLIEVFKSEGLKITVELGLKATDFLDVQFNLENGEYRPYRKPDNPPIYIDARSNHPKTILKQMRNMIENRLQGLSCNEKVFNEEKVIYEKALKDSGHPHELKFHNDKKAKTRKRRRHNPSYFNPPFSLNVKTNVGAQFLKLVDKHGKGKPLGKIMNRSEIKVSYCTMGNIKNHISKHNAKIRNKKEKNTNNTKTCNCKKDENGQAKCPLDGKCLTESMVYKAEINIIPLKPKVYYGLTERTFKARYTEHKSSFKPRIEKPTKQGEKPKKKSTIASYVLDWKKKGREPSISWSIKAKAHAYSSGSRQCDLCLTEKTTILYANPEETLNKRDELLEKCRHKRKFLLSELF